MSQAVMAKFTEVEIVPGHLPQECCEVNQVISAARKQRGSVPTNRCSCGQVGKDLAMPISACMHLEHMQRQQVSSVQHLQEEAPGLSLEALQKDLAKYVRQEAALCK
eukprot:4513707-Amphidinium_carterae.1